MPESKEDVAEYELQSLLGRGLGKSAAAETATATVCSGTCTYTREPTSTLSTEVLVTFISALVRSQVSVTGMHCSSCSTAVERALRYIPLSRLHGYTQSQVLNTFHAAELFQVSSQLLLLCCKNLPRYASHSCKLQHDEAASSKCVASTGSIQQQSAPPRRHP